MCNPTLVQSGSDKFKASIHFWRQNNLAFKSFLFRPLNLNLMLKLRIKDVLIQPQIGKKCDQ